MRRNAARGQVQASVAAFLAEEEQKGVASSNALHAFAKQVVLSKLRLYALLGEIKERGKRVYGIGAPSGPAH